ncbi:hypothetical protein [Streptomyces sp. NPDC005385]|uniref:hypothetical protein n=1 Tax=Streptomyces sp. NPDC005385 TaxID=3157039 RepID=UPI0033B8CE29
MRVTGDDLAHNHRTTAFAAEGIDALGANISRHGADHLVATGTLPHHPGALRRMSMTSLGQGHPASCSSVGISAEGASTYMSHSTMLLSGSMK